MRKKKKREDGRVGGREGGKEREGDQREGGIRQ